MTQRSRVNDKLVEMEKIEKELNPPKFFRILSKKKRLQAAVEEITAVREELMQVLLFLHLRE